MQSFIAIGQQSKEGVTNRFGMNTILLVVGIGFIGGITLLRPRLGLNLMLFLTPVQYYFVLASGGTLIKYIGWIVVFAWITQKILTRSPIGPWHPMSLLTPIVLFWYVCLISFMWSFDTEWKISIFSYTQLIIWVFLVLDLTHSQKHLEWLLLSVVLGVIISVSIMIYEFVTNTRTWEYSTIAEGGFGDRNTTAASFLYVIPILFYWLQHKAGIYRVLATGAIILLLIGIGIAVSRTNLIILPLLIILQIRSVSGLSRKAQYLIFAAILITISLPFWPWEHINYRFAAVWTGGASEDLGGRVGTTDIAIKQLQQSPFLGRGLGPYTQQYTVAAHNLFLEIASQLGVLGFLALVFIWVAVWRHLAGAYRQAQIIKNERLADLIKAIQLSLIVFFLFSLTVSTQTHRLLWFTFALSGICHNIVHGQIPKDRRFANYRRYIPPKNVESPPTLD